MSQQVKMKFNLNYYSLTFKKYSNGFNNIQYNFHLNTFDTLESASRARENLNGADIYSGCCTLKIDFAKVSTQYISTC